MMKKTIMMGIIMPGIIAMAGVALVVTITATMVVITITGAMAARAAGERARGPAAKRLVDGTVQGESEISRPWAMGFKGESAVAPLA